MEPSLEAIRFLANSRNRVEVLSALLDRQATRRELQEEVEGSRSTVARILDEAQTRGWVDTEGNQYWLTPMGESMVTGFRSYLKTVEGHQHLGPMVNHLPPPLFSIDFRHLRDADIIHQTVENPAAPFDRVLDLFHESTNYRGLNSTSLPKHAKVLRTRVDKGLLDVGQVFEKEFVETIRTDPERATVWGAMADGVWVYEGVVPINIQIVDETVLVWLGKSRDKPAGLLETDNAAVLAWAESLYEEYRREAIPLADV